jgi:hypothetical protein
LSLLRDAVFEGASGDGCTGRSARRLRTMRDRRRVHGPRRNLATVPDLCKAPVCRRQVTEPTARRVLRGPAPRLSGPTRGVRRLRPRCSRKRRWFCRAIGDIALWQGLGGFLERLDEEAAPHRVG